MLLLLDRPVLYGLYRVDCQGLSRRLGHKCRSAAATSALRGWFIRRGQQVVRRAMPA